MNNADRFIAILTDAEAYVCDDCASAKAAVRPRQQVHQIATRLTKARRVYRIVGQCCYCQTVKKVSAVHGTFPPATDRSDMKPASETAEPHGSPPSQRQRDLSRAWHWEGNVQCALKEYLESDGWSITAYANTIRKESGIDLAAVRSGRRLIVEVKGFPSATYEYGDRRGLPKPTRPTNQARQWYAHALLSVMRLLEKDPAATVALCFPDFRTYRRLIEATRTSLKTLGIAVYFVSEAGEVTELLPVSR